MNEGIVPDRIICRFVKISRFLIRASNWLKLRHNLVITTVIYYEINICNTNTPMTNNIIIMLEFITLVNICELNLEVQI